MKIIAAVLAMILWYFLYFGYSKLSSYFFENYGKTCLVGWPLFVFVQPVCFIVPGLLIALAAGLFPANALTQTTGLTGYILAAGWPLPVAGWWITQFVIQKKG